MREFECTDCGAYVFDFGGRCEGTRCATCEWLREHVPDTAERARLRELLDHAGEGLRIAIRDQH